MTHLLDSSVWVALFLDFDSQHKKAKSVFNALKGVMYVPYCVASETATVLAYKHSKEQADNFIRFIENNQDVLLLDDSIEEEMGFYTSVSAKISFTDAALVFLSGKLKANLVTFDKQLKKLPRK